MRAEGKKFIALFLVISLMMISANLYAKERRGALLVITKKNGQQISGELITVKENSLLLFTGKDVSVDIEDIKIIRIVKKSNVSKRMVIGLLTGVGTGVLIGLLVVFVARENAFVTLIHNPISYGIILGSIGLLVGSEVGPWAGGVTEKTILIEGMTDSEINRALDKLRKKARIPNYK